MPTQATWNDWFASEQYIYGTEPNKFLTKHCTDLTTGKVLCLAEGEGRNAVYLAEQGFDVTMVDFAENGLAKAARLAQEKGVTITTIHADLASFDMSDNKWDSIIAVFMHLPSELRKSVLTKVTQALVPDGTFLAEVYRPEQLDYGTGGPKDKDWLISLDTLTTETRPLEPVFAQETMREILEGHRHTGMSAVTQFIAKK